MSESQDIKSFCFFLLADFFTEPHFAFTEPHFLLTEKCLFSKISFEKTPVDPEFSQICFPEFQSFREFLFFSKPIFHKPLFKKLVDYNIFKHYSQFLKFVPPPNLSKTRIEKNWKRKTLKNNFLVNDFFLNIHPNERLMECRGTNVLSTHFFKTFGKIKLTKKV